MATNNTYLDLKYILVLLQFCFSVFIVKSQNITIKGKAHASHIGKTILLSDYTDYITYTKTTESIDTIDSNGYFELKLQSLVTKPILISIDNLVGKFYVQPNFVYGIYFPKSDSLLNNNSETETAVNISIYTKDSTELNTLIFDFNEQYNNLFSKNTDRFLSPTKINILLDSFLINTNNRYKNIKNPYFKKYLEYSFASLFSNTSRNKSILYKQFVEKKPILYSNYEYMDFFNTHYKGYLTAFASTKKGGSIYSSINELGDYNDLRMKLKSDKSNTNDTLNELLILKGLIDFYYSPDFDKKQVQSIIEQLYRETSIIEHRKIAAQMLQNIYKLQVGANAPNFLAENKTGTLVNLSDYKGKYIYLNFFSTLSDISLKEMPKIMELKKKFNDKVTFISVCLDDSISSYKTYLKTNPKYDWVILYQSKKSTAKQSYSIKSLSGFFLINQQMQLAQSPALMPSEGIEYKFNALFKLKKKNTIIGIR